MKDERGKKGKKIFSIKSEDYTPHTLPKNRKAANMIKTSLKKLSFDHWTTSHTTPKRREFNLHHNHFYNNFYIYLITKLSCSIL
jgi:hypothetical protein